CESLSTTQSEDVSVGCVLSGVITSRATEGGNAHIECPYDRGYETYQKYLSKGIYRDRVVVIQTQQYQHPAWTHQGRYSLYDDTERRVFTVTITNLTLEDADTYWCVVNTWGPDQPTEVRLTVDKGDLMFSGVGLGVLGDVMFSGVGLGVLGDLMFSGVGLGVVLLLLGLLLFMFFRERRDRDRRPTVSKHSARLLVPDSMTTNQDPDTGTIANPIYATATNQNPDTTCDITNIYSTATNPCPDEIHFNVGPSSEVPDSVTYATVNFPRDPACLHYATVNFPRDPALDLPSPASTGAFSKLSDSLISMYYCH
uniref:Immunoglobulin domain-containing protein n=1 Tax=Hucho hucho TaxID=62062 RepID=A0A4W5KVF2_9TELE